MTSHMGEKGGRHTRGPWKVISEATAREVEVFEIAEVSHFRVICDGFGDGFSAAGDAHADATLIASAPEMLAALRVARKVLAVAISAAWEGATEDGINEHATIKQIDAAIARATGEQS